MNAVPRAGGRALAVLAIGAALGLFWLTRTSRPSVAPAVARSQSEVDPPATSVELAPPAALAPRAETLRAEVLPTLHAPSAPVEPIEARCARVVSELAGWLAAPEFDRVEWQRRLRAHARSLLAAPAGDQALEALLATASDESAGVDRRVCAAELLRAVRATSASAVPAPTPGTLACLRAAAADPASSGPLAEAAACSLAALGTQLDVQQLLEGMLHGEDPERGRAAVALSFVSDQRTEVALEIVRGLSLQAADASRMEAGLSVLQGLARESGGALDAGAIAAELDALVMDPDLGPRSRRRALATLAALAPGSPALEASLAGEDPGAAAFELAARSTEEGARSLAVGLAAASSEPDDARRATLARALAYSPRELTGDARTMALAELRAGVRDPDPAKRRSAILALAALSDAAGASLVAEVARFDPDATVRASAVRALRGLERSVAVETWTVCARSDTDATVRALAEQELRRLEHALESAR